MGDKELKTKKTNKLLTAVLAVLLAFSICFLYFSRASVNIENSAVRKYFKTGVIDKSGPFLPDVPDEYSVILFRSGTIEYSTDPDFGNFLSVQGSAGFNLLGNLIPGKTYYYRAVYDGKPSLTLKFRTRGRVRMLKVDGIFNVRDIGGWKTTDGKRIKYGLIFRGSEMDGIHEVNITAKGIEQMKALGIRTEVDLRNSEEVSAAKYPLKSFADYSRYEIGAYMGVSKNKELYRDALLAVMNGAMNDKPVYVHCWGGADRTGTVIALLEGTLGVSKEDVIHDYELTSFSLSGYRIYGSGEEGTQFKDLVEYIENDFEGSTFNEKCTNLLLDLGISREQIESFRAKMLE